MSGRGSRVVHPSPRAALKRVTQVLRALIVVAFASALPSESGAQEGGEIVQFESVTYPGYHWHPLLPAREEGVPVTVFGILTVPNGEARVPAVVLTHGCGGISGAQWFWVKRLREIGIATFLINSFTPRNIPGVCRDGYPISMASTLTDVHRALSLLAAHPRIDAARVALMGSSFGGRTALWAAHPRFRQRYGAGPLRFAAHLALYPASCFIKLGDEHEIDSPIRIFHGTADDWTPLGPCRDYVARLRDAGKDAALSEYAGAPHGFDNALWRAGLTLAGILNFGACEFVEREGMIIDTQTGNVAGSDAPCTKRVASIGPSVEAQRQSVEDVRNFLKKVFEMEGTFADEVIE